MSHSSPKSPAAPRAEKNLGLSSLKTVLAPGSKEPEASTVQGETEVESLARDLGLLGEHPSLLDPPAPSADSSRKQGSRAHSSLPLAETLARSFDLQLELLRKSLGASGAVLLWADPEKQTLSLRGASTTRADLEKGPFILGAGISGLLLRERFEVVVAPVAPQMFLLPHYTSRDGIGAVAALKIPVEGTMRYGLLCFDREDSSPWSPENLELARLAARHLAMDIGLTRAFHDADRERDLLMQVCSGLKTLGNSLGMESTCASTTEAIRAMLPVDFVAISLVQDRCHKTIHAWGDDAQAALGLKRDLEQGILGKAIKYGRPLPRDGACRENTPIFAEDVRIGCFSSLLVLPLARSKGGPMGALTVAARAPGVFSRLRQDLLELLAAEVAVRIDLAQSHEQIARMATIDNLTGIANQRAFYSAFALMLHRARRQGHRLTLLLCDVDHFKRINDSFGHPFGDQVLKNVARLLEKSVRVVDLAARYGGEEFAVLLETTDSPGGRHTGERIRRAIEALELRHGLDTVRLSVSLGMATFPEDGTEIEILYGHADQALYRAKRGGRNRLVAWSDPPAP